MVLKINKKKDFVSCNRDLVLNYSVIFVVNFTGIKSSQMTLLRRKVYEIQAKIKIFNNTLSKFIFDETKHSCLLDKFKGQTFLIFLNFNVIREVSKLLLDIKISEGIFFELSAVSVNGVLLNKLDLNFISNFPTYNDSVLKFILVLKILLIKFKSTLLFNNLKLIKVLKLVSKNI